MATPASDSYTATSGATVYGGRGQSWSLPTVANGVTWTRYDVPGYPSSNMAAAPYGGTKHSHWARRSVDGCWYVLGGDYNQSGDWTGQRRTSAINALWKVTPGEPMTWTRLDTQVSSGVVNGNGDTEGKPSPAGSLFPANCDEDPFIYDSKRDRFLFYPGGSIRWPTLEGNSLDYRRGRLMTYDPSANVWTDLGSGTYTGPTLTTQLDPNGHAYPIDGEAKWGCYDEATDKFYIPQGNSGLMVLNASDFSFAEWPIKTYGDTGGDPYPLYHAKFYTACLCFDRIRRRFVSLRAAYDYTPLSADPGGMKLWCLPMDPDPVSGLRVPFILPQTNQAADPSHPIDIDTECLVHDEANDLYVLYGGGLVHTEISTNVDGDSNDFRFIPAAGGTWKRALASTGTEPGTAFTQTMHFDPKVGKMFMLGGITVDEGRTQAPEIFYAAPNAANVVARPSWRTAMAANTWTSLASVGTLAAVNPENDPAANPNYPGAAPWHGVGGQHSIVDAWNGACYDDVTHAMHIPFAGGHGDYWGNERYKIDLSATSPAWVRYGGPSGAVGNLLSWDTTTVNDDTTGTYADGAPRSCHTYNYPVYVPSVGPVLARLTAFSNSGHDFKKAFEVNPATGAFTLLTDYTTAPNSGGVASVGAACYDKTRHCIWMLHTGTVQLQKLDILTGTVTQHGVNDNHASGINALVYLPEVDALLSVCKIGGTTLGTQVSIWNLSTFAHTALSLTGSNATGFGLGGTQDLIANDNGIAGLQWDEVRHRLLMWGNSSNTAQISILTPGANYFTDPWTRGSITVSASNTVTPSAQVATGTYGRFAYSPSYDGVFLINGVAEPVFFFAFS